MGISDKTRKVLWGRSGSLCAFCKAKLVVDASALDREAVVGDECHINSGAPGGPRHEPTIPQDAIDDLANLILLCRVHHKLIDDQAETFSAATLKQLKQNHEDWVQKRLSASDEMEHPRLIRDPAEVPTHLLSISSAKDLLNLVTSCDGRYDDYPSDLSESELDCVGSFLQNLSDWADLGLNEPSEKIIAQKSLSEDLVELDLLGLRVFAAREWQQLRGGSGPSISFYMLHLQLVRKDDTRQIPIEGDHGLPPETG